MAQNKTTAAQVRGLQRRLQAQTHAPVLVCPFTDAPLVIKEVKSGAQTYYQAYGPFYVTKLFHTKLALEHTLSHRQGMAPNFSDGSLTISHVYPAAPSAVADQLEKDGLVEQSASAGVERMLHIPKVQITVPGGSS